MSLRQTPPKVAHVLLAVLLAAACGRDTSNPTDAMRPTGNPALARTDAGSATDAVYAGNAQSILAAPTLVPPGAPLAPFIEARLYAIANVAMHDAINGIIPRYARYADNGSVDASANAAAAVFTAAHDAIVGAAPGSTSATDAWYASAMGSLSGANGVSAGVVIGRRAAAAILAMRVADGVAAGGVAPYHPGSNPGDYRFTFPFNTPGFDAIEHLFVHAADKVQAGSIAEQTGHIIASLIFATDVEEGQAPADD